MKLSTKILAVAFVVAIALVIAIPVSATSYVFTRNLKVGSTGADVMQLQQVLNSNPATQVAVTGAGSPGNESSYFGGLTKAAVIKFQNLNAAMILTPVGLTQGTGLVGLSTRAFLNNGVTPVVTSNCAPGQIYNPATGALCTTTGGVVVSGPLSVSLANVPSYGALVSPSATAQLAAFTFTGTGTVTNVNLQRLGVSSDTTLSNVYLYDGAVRLTDSASVSSGNISFNNPSGLFTVTGSRTVTVRADIASDQGGAAIGVALANYTVLGGAPATVNLAGIIQSIASNLNPATVVFSANTVSPGCTVGTTCPTVNAGATNYTVWSAPVSVGTRAVFLKAISFKYIGSAPTNALANTQLLVDGAVIANGSIDANGFLTFDLSAAPLTLNTGSHTLTVNTNIVAGAYRSFQLSLQNAGDIMLADSQLQGVNVLPNTTDSSIAFSSNSSGQISINNGTVSVQVDPDFNPTTITAGATNVPIAQFKFTSYGEDVKVNSLVVKPMIDTIAANLNNVSLFVNGGQVGSTQSVATTSAQLPLLTFGSNNLFTIPAGQTVIVTIKADTINTTNVNVQSGVSISVQLPTGSSNAQGVQSSQIVNVPTGVTTSTGITVGSGSPTVAKNTALANFTTSPNVSNVKIGSYVIQASSAEGLRVNNIVIAMYGSLGATTPSTNFANIKLVTPAGTTNPVSPQTSNSFSLSGFTIPTNGTAIVDVYADVLGNAGTASTTIAVTAQGMTSNTSVSGSATGQDVTVGTGTMNPATLVSSSPVAQYVVSGVGGNSNFQAATYNFISTTSPATIQELHFAVSGSTTATAVSVTGPGMSTPISAPVVSGTATLTGLSIVIPVGYAGGNVVVTPTFGAVGLNGLPSPTTSYITLNYVKALIGSTTVTPTVSVRAPSASTSFSLVASKPTITIDNAGSSLVTGSVRLARVTVAADASGPIRLDQLPIDIQSNSAAAALAAQTLVIKDVNGNTLTAGTSTVVSVVAGNHGAATITFCGSTSNTANTCNATYPGYLIDAGTSVSFDIYATETGALGVAGASSLVTTITPASSFQWTDVNGNSTEASLYGTLLTNFPTNTSTISN